MAATDNEDSTTEKQSEQESSTLISVLTGMRASIDSGNSLLQELVSHKRSSPDDELQTSKRRKSCSASQKAIAMSSDEDENDASEEANTQHHHDASAADALSLFGGDIDEIEDTVLEDMEDGDTDNASLLSAISSDARNYKRSSGHSKQENNKYQQKRPFLVNRGRTFNPPKST